MKIIRNSFLLVLFLTGSSNFLFAQKNIRTGKGSAAVTPCMNVLSRFTAPTVPALGPDEEFAPGTPKFIPASPSD